MKFIDLIIDLITEFFELLGELYKTLSNSVGKPTGYSDDFTKKGKFISRWNHGFSVNGSRRGRLTRELSRRHMVVISGSGGGKSTRIVTNNILLAASEGVSMIINDESGELGDKTRSFLLSKGYSTKTIDPSNPQQSDGYNPIFHARDATDLSQISDLIIRANLSGQSDQSFWNESAKSIINVLLLIIRQQGEQFQNLYNLKYLLNQLGTPRGRQMLDRLVVRIEDPNLFSEYKSFISYDPKLQLNIISTAKSALQVLNDDNVARITSWNSISFDFRQRPIALFLKVPALSAERLSPITSLLIEQCFGSLMTRIPSPNERGVYFFLDELSSMVLPNLEKVLSVSRKYNVNILFCLQHPDQLKMKYGAYKARSILQNTYTKIYTSQSHEIARELSESLGYRDVEDPDTGRKRTMPLMAAREIATLRQDSALVFVGNHAFPTRLYPYYKNRKFRRYTQLPKRALYRKPPFEKPPLIAIHQEEPETPKS